MHVIVLVYDRAPHPPRLQYGVRQSIVHREVLYVWVQERVGDNCDLQ